MLNLNKHTKTRPKPKPAFNLKNCSHLCVYRSVQLSYTTHQKTVVIIFRLKAKFHYASWFEAGRRQARSQIPLRYLIRTSFEPASNQLRTN